MKLLIVIDMQNDFINGSLGSPMAVSIVENVKAKIKAYRKNGDLVIFTRDTHQNDYLSTQEGKNLPVPHCIENTDGWQISSELAIEDSAVINKPTFGSLELLSYVGSLDDICEIELVGLCTDICVISNAMLLKAKFLEVPISVDSSCCAGVSEQSHLNSLEAMKMCQISIK